VETIVVKKTISDVDFVTAWAKSKSLDDVVKATGLAKLSVQARAHRLRKAGVKLPKFKRQKVTDVEGLNDLLGTLLGKPAKKKKG
jgi:hypothetical protein